MAQEKIYKTAFCKRAHLGATTKATLQQLLKQAVAKFPKAHERAEVLGDNGTSRRLINNYMVNGAHGSFCGVLLSYDRGTNAVALAEDNDVEAYEIAQLAPPPTDDGKRREFLDGLLYFVVIGNHVAVMQSAAVRSGDFENHLHHLLNKAGIVEGGVQLALPDAIGADVAKRVKAKHVKDVVLGMPLVAPVPLKLAAGEAPPADAIQQQNDYFSVGGVSIDLLHTLFPGGLGSFKLADALNENIEMSLRISYKRKVTASGQAVLDKLAMALRNQDGADTVITLNGGEQIKGDSVKLSTKLHLLAVDQVVQPTAAFDAMAVWLHGLIQTGTVAP